MLGQGSERWCGEALTISQLRSTAGKPAACSTQQFNRKDQGRWAVIQPKSIAYLEAVHAVLWLGSVVCPINHELKAGEIAHHLTVSGPEFVVAYSEVVGKVVEAIKSARRKRLDWGGSPGFDSNWVASERIPGSSCRVHGCRPLIVQLYRKCLPDVGA